MDNFSLLVKPASFKCNLRCEYCFYLGKEELFRSAKPMTAEILERMVSSFLAVEMPNHSFGWQGGEPTLMGLDFFKKVTMLQEKYGRGGILVSNGLQTNGTLLDNGARILQNTISSWGSALMVRPRYTTATGSPPEGRGAMNLS